MELWNLIQQKYTRHPLSPRYFYQILQPNQQIESCLLGLVIMNYLISKRKDLVHIIQNLINENQGFFFSQDLERKLAFISSPSRGEVPLLLVPRVLRRPPLPVPGGRLFAR